MVEIDIVHICDLISRAMQCDNCRELAELAAEEYERLPLIVAECIRAGIKEHVAQPITKQGRLEDSAQISADLDLAAKRLEDAGYFSSAEHVRLAAQKLLPC
ncbi:MAG: hypothetical protein ACWGNI_00040 [Desulfobacterales bacterium]